MFRSKDFAVYSGESREDREGLLSFIERLLQIVFDSEGRVCSKNFDGMRDDFECIFVLTQPSQRLYRLLELVFRIKSPLNHLKCELSAGELKLLEIKLLICLKKNFS